MRENPVIHFSHGLAEILIDPGPFDLYADRLRLDHNNDRVVEFIRDQDVDGVCVDPIARFEKRTERFRATTDSLREILATEIQSRIQCCKDIRDAIRNGGCSLLDSVRQPQTLIRTHEIMTQIEHVEATLSCIEDALMQLDSSVAENIPERLWKINAWSESVARELFASMEMSNAGMFDTETTDDEYTWKFVQGILLFYKENGEPFTSFRALADEIGCCDKTVKKAISKSPTLKRWKAKSDKGMPRATRQTGAIMDQSEANIDDPSCAAMADDEVDSIMSYLIESATPKERAELHAMDKDARRRTAMAYNKDFDQRKPISQDNDGPSEKQHWRA